MKSYNNTKLKKKQASGYNINLSDIRGKGLSITELRQEKKFISYLKLLKAFSKRYTLLISVNNTPCGPYFTEEMAAEIMDIGLKINLFNRFRYAYAAVIDAGELLIECISSSPAETVEWQSCIGESNIEIFSAGWDANKNPNTATISIDKKNYAPNLRGFNFVLFDSVTKTILDACCFDTYDSQFPCHRPLEKIETLMNYKKCHPDVTVACFNMPKFPQQNLSDNEIFITQNSLSIGLIKNNLEKPLFALNKYFTNKEDLIEVLNPPKSYLNIYGQRCFEDTCGKYVNTANGIRVTTHQPQEHKHSIFILGGCTIFGVGSSDNGTIASQLQVQLNNHMQELGFIVHNFGYYLSDLTGLTTGEEFSILDSLPVKPGDIVLFPFKQIEGLPFFDLSGAATRPHKYGEVFFDIMHYTEDGNCLIADKMFDCLRQHDFFRIMPENEYYLSALHQSKPKKEYPGLNSSELKKLEQFKNILCEFYNSMFNPRIGSIVMNCNPFTMGHRYLIEQALLQCDHLMIFIVQEDKSIFSFNDRLKLVDEGTSDLKNVTVIPSGNFIISSLTFSEYFNKSELQDRIIDSSLDLTLFACEIAPCLNISVRFAGEEPFDNVTRQYNEAMRAILPQHGIEFVEISRKEFGGTAISASRVRKLIEEKNFNELTSLVPVTTLEYLIKRFMIEEV